MLVADSVHSFEMDGNLQARTRALLRKHGGSSYEIAQATGLNAFWINKFKTGSMADAGVDKVQALYEFLTGAPLLNDQ